MFAKLHPTLKQVFAFSLLGLLLSLTLLFWLISYGSQKTILKGSDNLRDVTSGEVTRQIVEYLHEAPIAVAYFEKQVQHSLVDPDKPDSIQESLLSLLLADGNLSEASFTYARSSGFDGKGKMQVVPSSAGEVTVFSSGNKFLCKRTWFDGQKFLSSIAPLQPGSVRVGSDGGSTSAAMDPTAHLTFQTPASKDWYGRLLWTDLHWSQLDESLPEEQRHVELSAQKIIENSRSQFAGVLRVGLMKDQINRAVGLPDPIPNDPRLIFLCDSDGRLITGFGNKGRITESGDDLRIASDIAPPQVKAALQLPGLKDIDADNPLFTASFRSDGTIYLCTFRALPERGTQDWIVGIVVPRHFYLADLMNIQRQFLSVSLILIALIIVVGVLILRSIGRDHSLILREAARMNAFEFSPSQNPCRLRDVGEVLTSLEKTKTAMRAMGKYVPVDLVRRLYSGGREPELGGESADLSVLFTDIQDFTSFSEQTTPDKVAEVLGYYMEAMASAIQGEKGTIDKFIGDGVMAFWNAPEEVPNHAVLACRAALKCRAALRDLYASPAWKGMPEFETRFGMHRCTAYVGHFGAPDRFNYTAIGDGINLASRLEGLNRHYGTTIIASGSIQSCAREQFEFRLLDRVAVQGKTRVITIYELVGEQTANGSPPPAIGRYEQAFEPYRRGDFKAALALLEEESDDRPGLALAARCRDLIKHPPEGEWTGIHVFESK